MKLSKVPLLELGLGISDRDNEGNTPLHLAALRGHIDLIAFLIAKGASLSIENNQGCTPLHIAAKVGHKKAVSLLLSNGGKDLGPHND